MEDELQAAIGEALELVSKKTEHAGRKRTCLLNHLRDQAKHAVKYYGESLAPKIDMVLGGSGDAKAAVEALYRETAKRALDEVDKYDVGLTAPRDVRWHQRHPIWTGAIGAAIAGAIGLITAAISGAFS